MIMLLAAEATEPQSLESLLLSFGPIVLVGVIFFLIITRANKRANPIRDRSLQHMDEMEAKADRMIELLEEIRDEQRERLD